MKKLILSVFTFLSLVCAPAISSAQDVKIGVLYPLTGPVAQVGKDAVAAVQTALDIINNSHNIPGMPLAKDAGLKGLGGGKISIVVGYHGGKPDVGVGETEKMLNSDKVHAMFGAYYSSVTGAASQVSERAGIPWVNGESTSPKLTTRGFKYFFRVTPHDGEFTQLMFEFMNDFNKKNSNKLNTLGIIHEDTLWGSDSGGTQNKMAKDQGYKVIEKISYKAKTTSLSSEVQRLKAKNPDVLLPSSYTADAYLFLNTAKELDYNPKLLVAQNAGYTDPNANWMNEPTPAVNLDSYFTEPTTFTNPTNVFIKKYPADYGSPVGYTGSAYIRSELDGISVDFTPNDCSSYSWTWEASI